MSKVKKMSKAEKERLSAELRIELTKVLDVIWIATDSMDFPELANRAGLSKATVVRLFYGDWKVPQVLTIQKLGRVVGYSISFNKNGIVVDVDNKVLSEFV